MGSLLSFRGYLVPGDEMHDTGAIAAVLNSPKGIDRSAAHLGAVDVDARRVRTPGIDTRQFNRIRIVYEQAYRLRYAPSKRGRIS